MVQWHNYIFRDHHDIPIQIVDISLIMDDLLENSTIEVFLDLNLEAWESCQFNPDFPELRLLKEIVKNHGKLFR